MNRHFVHSRLSVPTASVSRIGGRPMSHAGETPAIGFVSAIGIVTATTVIGTALITTVPLTVTVPIATALSVGLIASTLVALRRRVLGVSRRSDRYHP